MKKFTHQYINQVTGAFVLVALVILVAVLYVEGQGHHWFDRTVAYHLILPEEGSHGLKAGAVVMVLGTEAGEITDIEITPQDRMQARMILRHDFTRFIGIDSRVTIKRVLGMAGDAFVDISGRPGDPLAPDATLEAVVDRAVSDLVQETLEQIRNEILPAIQAIRLAAQGHTRLTARLEEPVLQTVATIGSIAAKIDTGTGMAHRVLADRQMADDIQTLIVHADDMTRETTRAASSLATAATQIGTSTRRLHDSLDLLPQTIQTADTTLRNIDRVSNNLIQVTASISSTMEHIDNQVASLSAVIFQAQSTLHEIQRLAQAVQQHWLIRGYVDDDPPTEPISAREVMETP